MTSGEFVNIRAAMNGLLYSPAGYFFAVEGTAYPFAPAPPSYITDDGGWWSGFASGMIGGLINAQDGLFGSAAIGYSASVIPMGPSVQQGIVYLATAVEFVAENYYHSHGNSYDGLVLLFSGYSQGAMVTASYWVNYILNPDGAHNHLAPFVYRLYQFGDPYRTPGIAHGNALAGLSESIPKDGVETGGIGGKLDVTVAQSNLLAPDGNFIYNSCANPGDLYSACPVGNNPWTHIAPAGKTGNLIFTEIQSPGIINTLKIAEALLTPIGTVEEIINGIVFASQGVNAPHWKYFPQMDACINDALALGNLLPHQSGF